MKLPHFIALVLAATPLFSAPGAPLSVAGRVFHESGGTAGLRTADDVSIVLRNDGGYHYLKVASGSVLDLQLHLRTLGTIPADGTYTYVRTGDLTATLTLSDPTGTLFNGSGFVQTTPITTVVYSLDFSARAPFEPSENIGAFTTGRTAGGFWFTELSALATAPLANASVRGQTSAERPVIMGFVVTGISPRDFLIRVIGPSLASFGVSETWADPEFVVYRSNGFLAEQGAYHNDWSAVAKEAVEIRKMSAAAGAFALVEGSKDAVAAVRLSPGAYTVVARPSGTSAGGETLIELYTQP